MRRQDWDSFFMDLAFFWANRSTCVRRSVGAIAVKDKRVLASGYNGQISGHEHCTTENCYRLVNKIPSGQDLHLCYALHAEMNIVLQAATQGTSLVGASIYCTTMPCVNCLKTLLGLKLNAIYFANYYDQAAIESYLKQEKRVSTRRACKIYAMRKIEQEGATFSVWEKTQFD